MGTRKLSNSWGQEQNQAKQYYTINCRTHFPGLSPCNEASPSTMIHTWLIHATISYVNGNYWYTQVIDNVCNKTSHYFCYTFSQRML